MSQREEGRRRSTLAGMNAMSSHAAQQSVQDPSEGLEEAAKPQEAKVPSEATKTLKKTSQAAPKAPKKKKVSFYLSPDEEARAEAARNFTMGHTGLKTVTSYYERAIAEFTRKLEAEYNDSKPFGTSSE